jgi:hypothetical protein
MKTDEMQVNEKQIIAAWNLIKTRLEYAKESLELVDTASATNAIECALALMCVMQGDVEDAPNEINALDDFVQQMVNDYNPTQCHVVHNPVFISHLEGTCAGCGLFYAQQGSRYCGFCESAGGNGQ